MPDTRDRTTCAGCGKDIYDGDEGVIVTPVAEMTGQLWISNDGDVDDETGRMYDDTSVGLKGDETGFWVKNCDVYHAECSKS